MMQFDTLAWPVLGYGAELWGWKGWKKIESLQEIYYCGQKLRRIFNLNFAGEPIRANSFIFLLFLLLLTSVPNFMSMSSLVT